MFDWVNFSPERLLRAGVIIGLILAIAGLVIAFASDALARAVAKKGAAEEDRKAASKAQREDRRYRYSSIFKGIGMVLTVVGSLTAILTI